MDCRLQSSCYSGQDRLRVGAPFAWYIENNTTHKPLTLQKGPKLSGMGCQMPRTCDLLMTTRLHNP